MHSESQRSPRFQTTLGHQVARPTGSQREQRSTWQRLSKHVACRLTTPKRRPWSYAPGWQSRALVLVPSVIALATIQPRAETVFTRIPGGLGFASVFQNPR